MVLYIIQKFSYFNIAPPIFTFIYKKNNYTQKEVSFILSKKRLLLLIIKTRTNTVRIGI